jgi:perosamine synthetase
MPEVCAAIMLAQLDRAEEIIGGRVEQAHRLIEAIGDIPGLRPPVVRPGAKHVYYTIPFLVERNRGHFCEMLCSLGVPIVEGYQEPLYRLPAFRQFARPCPVAEDLQDRQLLYFENCAWDLTRQQAREVGDAFKRAAEKVGLT